MIRPGGVDAMLIGNDFPELKTNKTTMYNPTHAKPDADSPLSAFDMGEQSILREPAGPSPNRAGLGHT